MTPSHSTIFGESILSTEFFSSFRFHIHIYLNYLDLKNIQFIFGSLSILWKQFNSVVVSIYTILFSNFSAIWYHIYDHLSIEKQFQHPINILDLWIKGLSLCFRFHLHNRIYQLWCHVVPYLWLSFLWKTISTPYKFSQQIYESKACHCWQHLSSSLY